MLKETVKQIMNKWENWEFQQNIPKNKLHSNPYSQWEILILLNVKNTTKEL